MLEFPWQVWHGSWVIRSFFLQEAGVNVELNQSPNVLNLREFGRQKYRPLSSILALRRRLKDAFLGLAELPR